MNAIVKPENLCLSVDQVAERLGGQTLHHSRKDAPVPPSLPSVVEVFAGPYSLGASHQRKPLRFMKIIPLRTRKSSTRGLPWLLGKNGRSRAICSSVSQKRLLILPPIYSRP